MGKNHFKKKNHKAFNPIRNVEKLQELRPKLKNLETDNNGRDPNVYSSLSEEKEKRMFSEKDRENILHIRNMCSKSGKMPEFCEYLNGIFLILNGDIYDHPILMTCINNTLKILSVKGLKAPNCSRETFMYVLKLNRSLPIGSFCYGSEEESFAYKLNIPLFEKPTLDLIIRLLYYTAHILDNYMPEIISHIRENQNGNRERKNPTIH